MRQQFFRLYFIITVSLIALVLAFGQLYNSFFTEQQPSIQLSVSELSRLAQNKHSTITELTQADLLLPEQLQHTFEQDGIISVIENEQTTLYLKTDSEVVLRISPIVLVEQDTNDWLAFFSFYTLLGILILVFIRPVFKDLSLLQTAAKRFSKKPQPIALDIKPSSSIAPLANTFVTMSERINRFIQLHGDLSRILSHEIRTPLTRMRFALSIADLDSEENTQIERDIEEIELRLEQYLTFARLEHQHHLFKQQPCHIAELIHTEVAKFSLYKELNFLPELQTHHVLCEPTFLGIAIQNLLINASKYAKQNIYITSTESDGEFQLSVYDDGPGLPINAGVLIEPFQQGENDKLASGYGLGLYIVHRIAAWHGGTVTLANHPKTGGAEITLSWPKSDR
jgi:signal transduction histidine kinase